VIEVVELVTDVELVPPTVLVDVVAVNMQEQPELNFDGDALQGDRKVGNPAVAVLIDARNGVQNEDAETAWFLRAFKQLLLLLCF
jgi:hypothetical protein